MRVLSCYALLTYYSYNFFLSISDEKSLHVRRDDPLQSRMRSRLDQDLFQSQMRSRSTCDLAHDLTRHVIRPRVRSYAESTTLTLSPGTMRSNFRRFIRVDPRLFGSHNYHRFNGDYHTGLQGWILLSRLDVVEHLRVFVHTTPEAVTTIHAHNGKARGLDMLLY